MARLKSAILIDIEADIGIGSYGVVWCAGDMSTNSEGFAAAAALEMSTVRNIMMDGSRSSDASERVSVLLRLQRNCHKSCLWSELGNRTQVRKVPRYLLGWSLRGLINK